MNSLHQYPSDQESEIQKKMSTTRFLDMCITGLIIFLLAIILGYVLGLERSSFAGHEYVTGNWDWRRGLVGAIIPFLGVKALYKWLRARRAKKIFYG